MTQRDTDAVRFMSNYLNSFGVGYQDFAKEMAREHRTLQQSFTRLCITWLQELSETEYYDLRNEGSVKFAQSIQDKLVGLPMI